MKLLPLHQKSYHNQLHGEIGETDFLDGSRILPPACLVLDDLWLRFGSTPIQIDAMILAGRFLYLYEVKNYSGNFYYASQQLFLNRSQEEVLNPLHQINKNRILLTNFLQHHGFAFQVVPYVVFIHPDFHMYQSPRDQPFLFRSQLELHWQQVAREGETHAHYIDQHQPLVKRLMTLRYEEEVRYQNFPEYSFASLKKGVYCKQCYSFQLHHERNICVCKRCGFSEKISQALDRTIQEFQLLFPNEKITKNILYQWCGEKYSQQRILRLLQQNYLRKGNGKASYYCKKELAHQTLAENQRV